MNEVICTMKGPRLRQVQLIGMERTRLVDALNELDVAQFELAEMYAAKEGHTEGKFTFERRSAEIVLVRITEKPTGEPDAA